MTLPRPRQVSASPLPPFPLPSVTQRSYAPTVAPKLCRSVTTQNRAAKNTSALLPGPGGHAGRFPGRQRPAGNLASGHPPFARQWRHPERGRAERARGAPDAEPGLCRRSRAAGVDNPGGFGARARRPDVAPRHAEPLDREKVNAGHGFQPVLVPARHIAHGEVRPRQLARRAKDAFSDGAHL